MAGCDTSVIFRLDHLVVLQFLEEPGYAGQAAALDLVLLPHFGQHLDHLLLTSLSYYAIYLNAGSASLFAIRVMHSTSTFAKLSMEFMLYTSVSTFPTPFRQHSSFYRIWCIITPMNPSLSVPTSSWNPFDIHTSIRFHSSGITTTFRPFFN